MSLANKNIPQSSLPQPYIPNNNNNNNRSKLVQEKTINDVLVPIRPNHKPKRKNNGRLIMR
jgi:hypothetical protein